MLHYSVFEQYFFEKILKMIILTKILAGIFRKKATKSKMVRMAAMAKMWKIRLSAGDCRKKSEISYGCKSLI